MCRLFLSYFSANPLLTRPQSVSCSHLFLDTFSIISTTKVIKHFVYTTTTIKKLCFILNIYC